MVSKCPAVEDDPRDSEQPGGVVGLAVGLAIVLVAIAASLLFALDGDETSDRTFADVAELHLLEPTAPPPGPGRRAGAGPPRASADPQPPGPPRGEVRQGRGGPPTGVTARILDEGWRPLGLRSDEVDGYAVETAIYRRGGDRLGHSLVVGEPDPPEDARRLGRSGILLRSFEQGGIMAVAWGTDGVSEVVAGVGRPRGALYDLAAGPA